MSIFSERARSMASAGLPVPCDSTWMEKIFSPEGSELRWRSGRRFTLAIVSSAPS
jgi:hypothetical protein